MMMSQRHYALHVFELGVQNSGDDSVASSDTDHTAPVLVDSPVEIAPVRAAKGYTLTILSRFLCEVRPNVL